MLVLTMNLSIDANHVDEGDLRTNDAHNLSHEYVDVQHEQALK